MCSASKRSGNKWTVPGVGGNCFPPSQKRGARCGCHQTHASSQNHDPVGSWPEPAGAARQWPHAPSTMRQGSGRMHLSPAGLARGRFHHTSTRAYASRAAAREPDHPDPNAPSSALRRKPRGRFETGERRRTSAAAARVRVYRFPLSAGAASARSPFATPSPPMGVRGRGAVTQMALGDLRMTHLPQSASSPRDLLRFSRYLRNINPRARARTRGRGWVVVGGGITADERSALRGCGCITQ